MSFGLPMFIPTEERGIVPSVPVPPSGTPVNFTIPCVNPLPTNSLWDGLVNDDDPDIFLRRCNLYTMLLILLAVAVPSTNKVTLSIPLQPGPEPEEIAVVTFDTDRVSAEELKRWMLLHRNSYFHTPVFGYYPECKPSDVPKLEEDIKKTQQIVDDLDPNKYPPALTDVVQSLKDL